MSAGSPTRPPGTDATLMILRPAVPEDFAPVPSGVGLPDMGWLRDIYMAVIIEGSCGWEGIRREAGFVGPVHEKNVTWLEVQETA